MGPYEPPCIQRLTESDYIALILQYIRLYNTSEEENNHPGLSKTKIIRPIFFLNTFLITFNKYLQRALKILKLDKTSTSNKPGSNNPIFQRFEGLRDCIESYIQNIYCTKPLKTAPESVWIVH